MEAEKEQQQQLHIVMVPWLAFGHLIPFLELAKSLAQKGNQISFISTPRNLQRLPKIPPNLSHLLTFIPIQLPPTENLPEKAEATSDLTFEQVPYLKLAYDGLEQPIAEFLESTPTDWVIYDFAPHWLPAIVSRLKIRSIYFSIFTASFNAFFGPPSSFLNGHDLRAKIEDFLVPPKWVPFPNNLVFRTHEMKKVFNASVEINTSGVSDLFRAATAIQGCDAVAVRTCREFESEWLSLLEETLFQKPVLPVGLLPPPPPPVQENGNEEHEWVEIREWLDKHGKKSVVYIALGSEATLSPEETTELALGLELSGFPFFWVLRKPSGSAQSDSIELPPGFEERTKGRGYICRSWAPQLRILGHHSIGGFLTHCGWSSVIEALGVGCPLVLLPVINDQAINSRVFESKKIGLEIERNEEDGFFSRDDVAKALKIVMVEEEGEVYRDTVMEWREVFGNMDRQDQYVDEFLQFLKENKNKN